jgi:hypothetical protein
MSYQFTSLDITEHDELTGMNVQRTACEIASAVMTSFVKRNIWLASSIFDTNSVLRFHCFARVLSTFRGRRKFS